MTLVAIIAIVLLGLLLWRYIVLYLAYKELKKLYNFSNIIPRRQYLQLADWLRKRKSKFSVLSKMELLNMWYGIIMTMPKEYYSALADVPNLVDVKDDITQAKWKQMLVEKLEGLQQMDDLDFDDLADVSFYIFNIIFR